MNRYAIFIALCAVIFLPSACSPRNTSSVVGTYKADAKYANEELTVNPDGTYQQVVRLKSGNSTRQAEGKWQYSKADGEITFDAHFLMDRDESGVYSDGYIYVAPVECDLGTCYIGSSEGVQFKK